MSGSQWNSVTWCSRWGSPASWMTAPSESKKETPTAPGEMRLMAVCGRRRPKKSITAAPMSGTSGISQMRSRKFIVTSSSWSGLPFQEIDLVDQHRLLIAEQRDENAQTYGRLGHGHGDHKDRENLPVERLQVAAEGHQVQVDGVENQLDRHHDDDDIAAQQNAEGADEQQSDAEDQVVSGCDGVKHFRLLRFGVKPSSGPS